MSIIRLAFTYRNKNIIIYCCKRGKNKRNYNNIEKNRREYLCRRFEVNKIQNKS